MTEISGFVEAALIFPDASVHRVVSGSLSKKANNGITFRAELAEAINITAFGDDAAWNIRLVTHKGTFLSPPLSLSIPEVTTGITRTTTVDGIDLTSWRLGLKGFTQETFVAPFASDVAARLGLLAGVNIVGVPQVRIPEFDITQASFQSHLAQLLRELGFKYRIGPSGEVVCYPFSSKVVTNRPVIKGAAKRRRNLSAKVDIIRFRKQSKFSGTQVFEFTAVGSFPNTPLNSPQLAGSLRGFPQNFNGNLGFITYLDAAGNVCQFESFNAQFQNVAVTSNQPAVAATFGILPANPANTLPILVRVRINGTPVGAAGFDPSFEVNYPSIPPDIGPGAIPDARLRVEVLESTVWPTKAFLQAMAESAWQEYQKDFEAVSWSIAFDPFFEVAETMPADEDNPEAICEQVDLSWGSAPSCSVSGYVARTPPPGAQAVLVFGGAAF